MNRLLLYLFLCLTALAPNALAAILAIDYGAEWIKAVLMAPGQPYDVLLDRSSKRKIQSAVGWKRDDRLFGSDAANIAGRFPADSFSHLKPLLGAPFDSPAAALHNLTFPAHSLTRTARGTIALRRPDGATWAVEELVAMQLAYVRELAESALGGGGGGARVTDAVVAVPPYFTQHERAALVGALEVAGMRAEGLVHDGTAVALSYALTRAFPPPGEPGEVHVVYDAGAGGVRATVVAFNALKDSNDINNTNNNNNNGSNNNGNNGRKAKEPGGTAVVVKGVGFDRGVGGAELDRRLRELLAADFVARHGRDVRADARGMAKLWREAARVKAILSANADAVAVVESLAFDVDYRAKVTRAQFEDACADLRPRFARPIFDALARAGLTLDNVTSVILTGGASRTPMVQAAVKAAVGESKIATNVNADEAVALGAGLYAAGLSRAFKTKAHRITDLAPPYDVQAVYESEARAKTGEGEGGGGGGGAKPARTIRTVLFPAGGAPLTRGKTLSVRRTEDVALRLEYRAPPVPGYPVELCEAEISGVPEALRNLTEAGARNPAVKVSVHVSESGFVTVGDAVMVGEARDESLTGKLKSLFGAGEAAAGAETAKDDGDHEGAAGGGDGDEAAVPEIEAPKKKKPAKDTVPLVVTVKDTVSLAMSREEKRSARERLLAIDRREAEKRVREEARNGLEGYLYRVRDLLAEPADAPFMKCSKAEERAEMRRRVEEAVEWLHEHGDEAGTREYVARREAIEKIEKPVMHRYHEVQEFPRALNTSQMWNWSARMFITEAKIALDAAEGKAEDGAATPPPRYTREEIAELEKTLIEHETWLNAAVERQKAATMYDDPAVESAELRARVKPLEERLQRLMKKKVPRRKTSASSSSTASASATTAGTTSSAQAEESTPPAGRHDEL